MQNDTEKFLDFELETSRQRIKSLEESISLIQDQQGLIQEQITQLTLSLRDTQRYLIKLAQNYRQVSTRVAQWPYLNISNEDDSRT
jgi:septal ring factor EnvC (AmiA/AmiB activator)